MREKKKEMRRNEKEKGRKVKKDKSNERRWKSETKITAENE